MNIEKLAEEKYPMTGFFARSEIRKGEQKAFISGYKSCETRSKKIVEALKDEINFLEDLKDLLMVDWNEIAFKKVNERINSITQALTDYEGEEGIK